MMSLSYSKAQLALLCFIRVTLNCEGSVTLNRRASIVILLIAFKTLRNAVSVVITFKVTTVL